MAEDAEDAYGSSGSSGSESDRPNRWNGPPSTWKDMNREEINTLTALDELRNRDLSVHLYNTHALKQRHKDPENNSNGPQPEKDLDAATGQTIRQDDWLPHRNWTAWPMSASRVPPDEFMRSNEDDPDGVYTIGSAKNGNPSAPLEDAVAAAVLRFAKARFAARPWEGAPGGPESEYEDEMTADEDEEEEEADDSDPETATDPGGRTSKSSRSRSRSRSKSTRHKASSSAQPGEQDSEASEDDPDAVNPPQRSLLQPTVAEDDELSYKIMRPSVRNILTKMDATLMVLHHSRSAAVNWMSDPPSDTDSEVSDRARRSRSRGSRPPAKKRRGRGRPPVADLPDLAVRLREPPAATPAGDNGNTAEEPALRANLEGDVAEPQKKLGRPRKVYPRLEGETDDQWTIRVARLRKEPIPKRLQKERDALFKDARTLDSDNPKSSGSEASPVKSNKRSRGASRSRGPSPGTVERRAAQRRKNALRYGMRDWKDVLGAAALAGFSRDALDRAARRCADLFGGSMELHTMNETLLDDEDRDQRVQFHPGMVTDPNADLNVEDEDDYSSGEDARSMTARHIRASSAVSASSDVRGRSGSRRRSRSRSISQARSRSGSASATGTHFCTIFGCPRNTEAFSRRTNLVRHMKLVHGVDRDEVVTDIDSEDEMHGAVHVDGFLKPIKIRQGWRGDDGPSARRRPGRRHRAKRDKLGSATETGADDSDIVMGDD
ncbi:hypothetical protein KJ359_009224 [Pestalotiopsis sp. 9143b]|nr:hypothetical protein KJ359_009224 [Pestalotiopsis sp. 9143b]